MYKFTVVSLHEKGKMSSKRRKELFYYVTSGSNVRRDVHRCVTVDYQQIANGNIANQIHGFTIDYGKFILISNITSSNLSVANQVHLSVLQLYWIQTLN